MTGFSATAGERLPAGKHRESLARARGGASGTRGATVARVGERGGAPRQNRRILLIADMDGLPDPGGSAADCAPPGRYIHSCGHHMQMTVLYGAARILAEIRSPALTDVEFCAVPAEEFIDRERRQILVDRGLVRFLSGKQELLSRGYFGPFRYVVATHAAGVPDAATFTSVRAMNGFDRLAVEFTGKASHAGAHPHRGRNAQNAASLFLQACAFLRESFDEEDHVRIHPILRLLPDQSVNLIPEKAFVETYVRGVRPGAVKETAEKLSAAAAGCAKALGVEAAVSVTPGYAPFHAAPLLHELTRTTAEEAGLGFVDEGFSAASSDMGDVSAVVPSVIVGLPGSNGMFHNRGFSVTDERAAYLLSSRFVARCLERLAALGD